MNRINGDRYRHGASVRGYVRYIVKPFAEWRGLIHAVPGYTGGSKEHPALSLEKSRSPRPVSRTNGARRFAEPILRKPPGASP